MKRCFIILAFITNLICIQTYAGNIALLIGIEEYGENRAMIFAQNNLKLMKQIYIAQGFDEFIIVEPLPNNPRKCIFYYGISNLDNSIKKIKVYAENVFPDKKLVLKAIDELINNAKKSNKTNVSVYFTGHGGQVKDIDGDEANTNANDEVIYVYYPKGDYKTNPDAFIIDDILNKKWQEIQKTEAHLSLFFDSCHAGGIDFDVNRDSNTENETKSVIGESTGFIDNVLLEIDSSDYAIRGSNISEQKRLNFKNPVLLFSASIAQVPAPISIGLANDDEKYGTLTWALYVAIKQLANQKNITYFDVLQKCQESINPELVKNRKIYPHYWRGPDMAGFNTLFFKNGMIGSLRTNNTIKNTSTIDDFIDSQLATLQLFDEKKLVQKEFKYLGTGSYSLKNNGKHAFYFVIIEKLPNNKTQILFPSNTKSKANIDNVWINTTLSTALFLRPYEIFSGSIKFTDMGTTKVEVLVSNKPLGHLPHGMLEEGQYKDFINRISKNKLKERIIAEYKVK